MKINILGEILKGDNGKYRCPMVIGQGTGAKTIYLDLDSNYQPDSLEPTNPLGNDGLWAYHGMAVEVIGRKNASLEETILRIKHAVIRYEKEIKQMKLEIEEYENNKKI